MECVKGTAVRFSVSALWRHTRMAGAAIYLHSFWTSAVDAYTGQLHAIVALPSGNNPGTHREGGFVGPTAGLDILEIWKIPYPLPGFEPLIVHLLAWTQNWLWYPGSHIRSSFFWDTTLCSLVYMYKNCCCLLQGSLRRVKVGGAFSQTLGPIYLCTGCHREHWNTHGHYCEILKSEN